jgi:hypothetical protein
MALPTDAARSKRRKPAAWLPPLDASRQMLRSLQVDSVVETKGSLRGPTGLGQPRRGCN